MDTTDCEWGDWSEWERCTKTCGGGLRTKTRSVTVNASDGGKECAGSPKVTQACNVLDCPVDCAWTEWEDWSNCSKHCGFGQQSRTRAVSTEARYGGDNCSGNATEIQSCNSFGCPVDCLWGGWEGWAVCSRTCGGGRRERTRPVVTEKQYAGKSCKGNATQRETCNEVPCPVDCAWGEWGGWDKCSKPCGSGTASRTRNVSVRAAHDGKLCEGLDREDRECNAQPCVVACEWADWGSWGSCTATCGGATRARNRTIRAEAQAGGAECLGADNEQEPCRTPPCAVDCSWQDWGPWQSCICGAGTKYRTREMNLESNGGQSCPDKDTGGMERTACDPGEACVSAVKAVDYGNGTKPEAAPNRTSPDINKKVENTVNSANGTKPDADAGTNVDAANGAASNASGTNDAPSSGTDSSGTTSSDTKSSGTDSSGTTSSDTNSSGTDSSGTTSSDTKSSGTDSSGTTSSDTNSSGTTGSGTTSSDTKSSGTDSSGTTSSDTKSSGTDSSNTTSSSTASSDTDGSGASSSANASAAGGADQPATGTNESSASAGGSSAGAAPNGTEGVAGSSGGGASGFSGQVVGSIRLTVGRGEGAAFAGEATAAAAMREAVAGLAGVPPALVRANLTVLPNGSLAVEFAVEMSGVSGADYADEHGFAQALAGKDTASIQEEVNVALAKHNLEYTVQVQALQAEAKATALQNSGAASACARKVLLIAAAAAAVLYS